MTCLDIAGEVLALLVAETRWSEAKPCDVNDERRELAGVLTAESVECLLFLGEAPCDLRLNTRRKSRCIELVDEQEDVDEAEQDDEGDEGVWVGEATSSESCVRVLSIAWWCTSPLRCEWG